MGTIKSTCIILLILMTNSNNVSAASASAPQSANSKLIVEIHTRNNQGKIMALLFNKEKGFPNDAISAHRQGIGEIHNMNAEIVFQQLQAGNYALVLFHDENNDSKLNKHWYGKPEEGVATSNNVIPRFSSPTFEECRFYLSGDLKINLAIHYFD